MSKSKKKIRLIDAISFEKKIRQHDLWNKEGVINLLRLMPTIEPEDQQKDKRNCDECALNTDHGKACFFDKCEFTRRTNDQEGKKK